MPEGLSAGLPEAKQPPITGGRLLARNSLLSLAGQVVPLIIAVFTIPLLISGLGADRFGVLAISWLVLGYFTLFDLGLSRATTKYFAEILGRNERERLPGLFWTSLSLNIILGILAGLILALLTPFLVERVFSISGNLAGETRSTFLVLSASLPVILATGVLRGVLEAGQRFDLINPVQICAGSLLYVLPLIGLFAGLDLAGIVALLMIARFVFAVLFLLLCFRVFPVLKRNVLVEPGIVRALFSFGGWMTVSNVIGPGLLYIDRFMIGSLISMAAVAYYTAPFEILIRLMVFPSSIVAVLFPAFSVLGATSQETIARLYTRSIKYLLVVMGPVLMLMILFAGDILRIWIGPGYADKSSSVLQILAVGMLLTPVQVSLSLIQGTGRPDIAAKFYLVELIIYVPLVAFMAKTLGIEGVAAAWTMRAALDTVLLLSASVRLFDIRLEAMIEHGLIKGVAVVSFLAAVFLIMLFAGLPFMERALAASLCVTVFLAASWRYVMDSRDREILSFGRLH